MQVTFKHAKIRSIATVVPQTYINIDDEIEFFQNSEKKLNRAKNIIGYGKRHVTDKYTTTVDLCTLAAKKLLEKEDIDKDSIDALIFVSQTPDYKIPASSYIIQNNLKISQKCACLDLSLGCSGFVYGLWNAFSLVETKSTKRVLLCVGDCLSKLSNKNNRLVNPVFGDAAAAVIVEYTENVADSYFNLGSDGSGYDKIIVPAGQTRIETTSTIENNILVDEYNNTWKLSQLYLSGLDVFNFTMDKVPTNIENLLQYANKNKSDIELYALHSANKQIINSIADKLEISYTKMPSESFSKYGNTSSASIPLVLKDYLTHDMNNIILCGFGVGLSWGSCLLDLTNDKIMTYHYEYKNETKKTDLIEYWTNKFTNKGE